MRFKIAGQLALPVFMGIFYALFLLHPINLTTADLGRHLKNGEALFTSGTVIKTNFYSSTFPSFPVTNHHWGSGALFFLVWLATGFSGLHVFFVLLCFAALFIFFWRAQRDAGAGIAALCAIPVIFLLSERTEVRPEILSYIFCGIFIWVLCSVREHPARRRLLFILPLAELCWVNSHIYFFLGPCIIMAFVADRSIAGTSGRAAARPLVISFFATGAAALVNPFGLAGAAAPFLIFKNYGYRLAENQSVWFMERITTDPNFLIFKIMFALTAGSFILRAFKKRGADAAYVLLALGISAMAWLQIRNLALFGLFSLPITAANIRRSFSPESRHRHEKKIIITAVASLCLLIIPASFGHIQRNFPYWQSLGIGLEQNNSASADFFKIHNLRGPIFNNYDIGGYLIFHLFPRERVFTDNRPEAYPASFFTDTYVPMQESDESWRAALKTYGFNAIFFSHRDATPWGQRFLMARVNDPEWAPVFADRYAIIFLKRNAQNDAIIRQYEIPASAFTVQKP